MLVAKKKSVVEAVQITSSVYAALSEALDVGLEFDDDLNLPEWLNFMVFASPQFVCDDGYLKLRNEDGKVVSVLFEGDWLVKRDGEMLPAVYSDRAFRAKFAAISSEAV